MNELARIAQINFAGTDVAARFDFLFGDKIFEVTCIAFTYKIVTFRSVFIYIIQNFLTFFVACLQMVQHSFGRHKTRGVARSGKGSEIINAIRRSDNEGISVLRERVLGAVQPR